MLVCQKGQDKGRGCPRSHCSGLGLLNPGVWLHPSAPGWGNHNLPGCSGLILGTVCVGGREEGGGAREPPSAPRPSPWVSLTHGCANAIALGVNEATDLGEVAVPLCDVLYGSGLHEQSVVRRECPLDALLIVLHQRGGLAAHEGPHLLKRRDLGFLGGKGWDCLN